MEEEVLEEVFQEEQDKNIVIMYNYRDVSKLLGVNANKALEFLKKFGVKIGHWQIEHKKLLKILTENKGTLI